MAGAMTAAVGAAGTRAAIATRVRARLGERALRRVSVVLLGAALLASALLLPG
jgi:hypothetical protein